MPCGMSVRAWAKKGRKGAMPVQHRQGAWSSAVKKARGASTWAVVRISADRVPVHERSERFRSDWLNHRNDAFADLPAIGSKEARKSPVRIGGFRAL